MHELARTFASRVKEENATPEGRIARMFELALGRRPSPGELASAKAFLTTTASREFKGRNRVPIEAEIAKLRERIEELKNEGREERLEQEELKELRGVAEDEIAKLKGWANAKDEWYELALAVFSMKEFIYLR